ncbi:hypothetical protein PILCRDRAFT_810279 [Piloderma croceum F 1598]|uniref:Uncharacterized protein n=1 Tax=Piloderma croceum (strain F 1598) TaxID=765440 RepID=A0A0C3GKZ3_PILCF|nr:hypothetical protein PILCRDRAFT_810279 [Piloderma croceum F 1598]
MSTPRFPSSSTKRPATSPPASSFSEKRAKILLLDAQLTAHGEQVGFEEVASSC